MTVLRTARVVAAILATVMLVFLALTGAIRADNPFMVPDLLLSVLLLVTACLPARWAAPALLFAFGLASGVWTASLSHYAVRGELVDGLDHLPLIGACVIQSVFLVRRLIRGPVGTPRDPAPAGEPAAG
jgi:ABC-type dipeptide/oligopeptide/nickel transport system permease component